MQAVPGPGLGALAQRVVHDHRNVDLFWLVLRHAGFERLFVAGDDSEALRRNAVSLRTVSITAKGNAQLAFGMRSQDNSAGNIFCERLLKNAAVDDFNR